MSFPFRMPIDFPSKYHLHDFENSCPNVTCTEHQFSIGKYNEPRKNLYTQKLFTNNDRYIHVGIDFGGPQGSPVYAVADGVVFAIADNSGDGDYGPTVITQHMVEGKELYCLYGHLSKKSLSTLMQGRAITKGDLFGELGGELENGGWPPHLHFQVSHLKPAACNLPGVVSLKNREQALMDYPDPQFYFGALY
ncbi:MAG: peptidoglycan DD-metalloendopeptidase family protein [Bdellovibrionaceae bacterium]|nr:peptidoglycan DD-metalloendopeptidase family protein [Pseudobdellovibrionaceae bacterium]